MVDNEKNQEDIGENDIVFECPHCAKSLAIDCRGAGLTIRCPDCGEEIEVPIPAGVDITDIDRLGAVEVRGVVDSEGPVRLPESQEEIQTLMTELEELRFRRRYLEKRHAAAAKELQAMRSRITSMRTALDEITDSLNNMLEPSSDDTQSLA